MTDRHISKRDMAAMLGTSPGVAVPFAVVVFDDDGAGRGTRDLGHIEVGRAETLYPCCSHDVAGRPGQGRQPVAQDRRMVWSAFCGHSASIGEAPRPA